ncbi:MAG TPA: SpoIID/LytB domain-containing protein [Terracidiphilus sp.]|jgi:stage II sporulation protein D
MKSRLAVLLLTILASAAPAQSPKAAPRAAATLRVGLWTLWHDREITVARAPGSAATLRFCASCAAVPLARSTEIRAVHANLSLPGNRQATSIMLTGSLVVMAHGESLTLHNPLRISACNGELILVVTLPVETYVERVVASESGAADSPESLKALAIVVRSFALHQAHGHSDYDLCDSTHCQLLRWKETSARGAQQSPGASSAPRRSAESVGTGQAQSTGVDPSRLATAHAAALATGGETLWYRGQRAAAWFHQNCGGQTASPQEVWPQPGQGRVVQQKQMPWLVSRADPYCTLRGAREWSASVSLSDLTAALAAGGLVRPGWKTLTVARRGESGRAVTLLIGSTAISAEDFRLAVGRVLGWNKILSTWFEVSPQHAGEDDLFLFHGRGSGHGVGLCQAGAAAMSTLGRDSSQILGQYFPGATVADEASGLAWQTVRAQTFVLQTLAADDAAYLPQISKALAEAEARSGLQPPALITVRAFRSTPAFRDATLAPGWVAAFTEGSWIATQPLATLAARQLLVPTLRHEFLHALIEAQAAPSTSLWLREGLVEVWSDAQPSGNRGAKLSGSPPILKLDETDRGLTHAATEAQSEAAHQAAAGYAQRLLDRYGRAQVLAWLRAGLPASALPAVR